MSGLLAVNHILKYTERGKQHEVLMHHAQSSLDRIERRVKAHRLPAQQNLALVRRIQAVKDIHQRGLACTIFADQRPDFALVDAQINPVIGQYTGEAFGDVAEFEEHESLRYQIPSVRRCQECPRCLDTLDTSTHRHLLTLGTPRLTLNFS